MLANHTVLADYALLHGIARSIPSNSGYRGISNNAELSCCALKQTVSHRLIVPTVIVSVHFLHLCVFLGCVNVCTCACAVTVRNGLRYKSYFGCAWWRSGFAVCRRIFLPKVVPFRFHSLGTLLRWCERFQITILTPSAERAPIHPYTYILIFARTLKCRRRDGSFCKRCPFGVATVSQGKVCFPTIPGKRGHNLLHLSCSTITISNASSRKQAPRNCRVIQIALNADISWCHIPERLYLNDEIRVRLCATPV